MSCSQGNRWAVTRGSSSPPSGDLVDRPAKLCDPPLRNANWWKSSTRLRIQLSQQVRLTLTNTRYTLMDFTTTDLKPSPVLQIVILAVSHRHISMRREPASV